MLFQQPRGIRPTLGSAPRATAPLLTKAPKVNTSTRAGSVTWWDPGQSRPQPCCLWLKQSFQFRCQYFRPGNSAYKFRFLASFKTAKALSTRESPLPTSERSPWDQREWEVLGDRARVCPGVHSSSALCSQQRLSLLSTLSGRPGSGVDGGPGQWLGVTYDPEPTLLRQLKRETLVFVFYHQVQTKKGVDWEEGGL